MAQHKNEDNILMMFNRFYHMCKTKEQRTLVLDMKYAFLEIPAADVVPKGEWISVEDRLPEDVYGKNRKQITVIVCTESGKVSTTSRQRIVKFNSTKLEWEELDTFEWSKRKRVTHWMPLPEAPKMKGGEE